MSVDYWLDLMRNHSANLVGAVLRPLWDSLFVAFPALSIAGIVATVIVNRASLARLWFFLVFLSLPMSASSSSAREQRREGIWLIPPHSYCSPP